MSSSRRHLDTERAHATPLDRLDVGDAFDLFDREDRAMADRLAESKDDVVAAIELVVERLARGGRLLYVGAGTSGRLGVLDATECPPTFGTAPEDVQGRIAGGPAAVLRSVEGAEDSRDEGRAVVDDVGPDDVVFGITAGGTTPFVHAAIERARELGAGTVFLACVPRASVADSADVSIRLATGPEVLAGSTRLKAGTATKMVLNRVSTIAMARLGHVFEGRMVDVASRANTKLEERARTIVEDLTGLDPAEAARALERADGHPKLAALMARTGLARDDADALLQRHDGVLPRALASASETPPTSANPSPSSEDANAPQR